MAGFQLASQVLSPFTGGLGVLSSIARTAGDLAGGADTSAQDLALRQLQEQQRLQAQGLAEDTALKKAQIAADALSAEEARRAALKRAVARQRATYGASGIAAENSGSAQAVLLGLFDESEEERTQRERNDQLRLSALDQNVAQANRLNVLQQTQLRERQRVQNAGTSFADKLLNIF